MMTIKKTLINARDAGKLSKKLIKDFETVSPILDKAPYDISPEEATMLLTVYKVAYHDSGKIDGVCSCDSSCNGCTFCACMRQAAEHDNTIICGKCYDNKQESYKANVKYRHMLNLWIMSSVLFTEDELKFVSITALTRINSSGDIENLVHARNMIRLAKAHPYAHVALWTKNIQVVAKAFDIEGKPKNMVYIASSIHINQPAALPKYADYIFTVYNNDPTLQAALMAGAVECNGKKCRDCNYKCYLKSWPVGANIAELLK